MMVRMSAAPRFPIDLGYAGLRMTADEYLALGETQERYQLIDGVVTMSPKPTPLHQGLIVQIIFHLETFARANPGVLVFPDTDVRFGPHLVYEPDISVYRTGRLTGVPRRLTEAPDLIVEVLSPGSKALDLITKRSDYERFGVGEYWVIDPATGGVRCWRRQGVQFVEAAADGESLASTAIPGFVLDLGAIRPLCRNQAHDDE